MPAPMRSEGFATLSTLPDVPGWRSLVWSIEASGDTMDALLHSNLLLYENGKRLGPAHTSHDAVRMHGNVAYSHWGKFLYYSASDNSDPVTNGRAYKITVTLIPKPWISLAGFIAAVLLAIGALTKKIFLLTPRGTRLNTKKYD